MKKKHVAEMVNLDETLTIVTVCDSHNQFSLVPKKIQLHWIVTILEQRGLKIIEEIFIIVMLGVYSRCIAQESKSVIVWIHTRSFPFVESVAVVNKRKDYLA